MLWVKEGVPVQRRILLVPGWGAGVKPEMVAVPEMGTMLPETDQISRVEAEGRVVLWDSLSGMPSKRTRCLERRRGMGVCVSGLWWEYSRKFRSREGGKEAKPRQTDRVSLPISFTEYFDAYMQCFIDKHP